VAKFSLSRHDTQARVCVVVSLASCVALAGLAFLVLHHLDRSEWIITYGKQRRMVVQMAAAFTLLLAAIGFGMGLNSAGQRRNDKPILSWIGFFVGAGVICFVGVLMFLFLTRGEMITY
jgi:hypothetical protein